MSPERRPTCAYVYPEGHPKAGRACRGWFHSISPARIPHHVLVHLDRDHDVVLPAPSEKEQDALEEQHRADFGSWHGHAEPVDLENCPKCADDFEYGWDLLGADR